MDRRANIIKFYIFGRARIDALVLEELDGKDLKRYDFFGVTLTKDS